MDGEQPAQVTPSLLRRGVDMCRRRLAHELRGGKRYANKPADVRFAVSNRLEADARLAQAAQGAPRPEAFVEPTELEPEQRALYRAARKGYLEVFGATVGEVVDLRWRSELPELDVEIVVNPGIAIERVDGRRELRKLHFGSGRLLDPVDVKVALVQTREWAPAQLDLVAVDLVDLREARGEPDVLRERPEALEWIATRITRLQELAADGRPRAGSDCQGCAFIAGCTQHASST
jgi:hypothetical protein